MFILFDLNTKDETQNLTQLRYRYELGQSDNEYKNYNSS
jgi:hypothetical protein